MLYRIEAGLFPHLDDTIGRKTAASIREALGIPVKSVRTIKVFTLEGLDAQQVNTLMAKSVLHDPVLQAVSLSPLPLPEEGTSWIIEVGYRPGVTDNEGRTARDTAALVLGIEDRSSLAVYTSIQYRLHGPLTEEQVTRIARDLLANELIQRFEIKSRAQWDADPGFAPKAARVTGASCDEVNIVPLSSMSDAQLMEVSQKNTLALSLEEMTKIKNWFSSPEVAAQRKELGLPADPTDAELEVLAQTWSEHCKHKIFASKISYTDKEAGTSETINSLYKTCIMNTTKQIRESLGDRDFCRSVFKDNAGVIAFTPEYDACIKVETHNSPSALDPYGGALTGIVGVNRDPMGTGLGAELICNTDVFCFASPFHDEALPPRLLHPRRVFEGVREGVEHGGNKSGIPTVNGSIVFDERYLGKPLVYCGTIGLIPAEVPASKSSTDGKPRKGYEKKAQVGDIIVMTGGRIGKDGIHGATFSSEELHEGSPATAVQIGDPITQRKMYDFIMRARDLGLYNAITDNGAGGLSSSIGEMAEDTNGCRIDLARAPLKYDGLRPWEILLSEAQERMTLAVPPAALDEFLALAKRMDVEATPLGEFTDDGIFHVTYNGKLVTHLDMEFMHDGVPQYQLNAVWEAPVHPDARIEDGGVDQAELLKAMLGRLNICSKEYLIRQYDHEVKGGSVVKPLTGVKRDGPSDAGVIRPILESEAGLVISHGICPKYSDYDAYWMMANAMDEGIRNAVAVGADPDRMAGVDNFCWCDPVQSEKTPDGEYKLAQLVRACKALSELCVAYGVPCISGKDSMKNDYTGGGKKISIPPTVLFSVLGIMDDVKKAVTSDFKKPGDRLYIIGNTARELAGSEIADQLGIACNTVPRVDAKSALASYRKLHQAINSRLISACHDLSDGGLAVSLAEMCIGGRLGAHLALNRVPVIGALTLTEALYSESASRLLVSVAPDKAAEFEALFGASAPFIGEVTSDARLTVASADSALFSAPVEALAHAFKATMDW